MVKTFGSTSPPEAALPNATPLEFTLAGDPHVYTAYPPKGGQMLVLMAAMRTEEMSGIIQFLMGILSEDDFERVRDRLVDREDPLDLPGITDMFQWLMEEWSKDPTPERSVSSVSRTSTGRSSTAKRRSVAQT